MIIFVTLNFGWCIFTIIFPSIEILFAKMAEFNFDVYIFNISYRPLYKSRCFNNEQGEL